MQNPMQFVKLFKNLSVGKQLFNCPTRWSLYCPLGICTIIIAMINMSYEYNLLVDFSISNISSFCYFFGDQRMPKGVPLVTFCYFFAYTSVLLFSTVCFKMYFQMACPRWRIITLKLGYRTLLSRCVSRECSAVSLVNSLRMPIHGETGC